MAIFLKFPVARRQYHCTGDGATPACTRTIAAGTRYCRSVTTPNHDDYGNDDWFFSRLCPPCAAYYRTPVPEAVAA